MNRNFNKLLQKKWDEGKFLCVGLDSDFEKLPNSVKNSSVKSALIKFNKAIVDATFDLVCAYKPQSSFYEAYGSAGLEALKETVKYIQKKYPDIPIILDAKRADIGNTNLGYTKAIFDDLGFDGVTVNPYLGEEALLPFLKYKDKGIIVLVKTSNPGSGEFQDLVVAKTKQPLYKYVAKQVSKVWNKNGNLAVVVGATYPSQLKEVREIVGDIPILIPGIGAQGGDVLKTVKNAKDSKNQGMIISSSRGIIFVSSGKNFAEAAREKAVETDNQIRNSLNG
ncbi:MAG: Orotidine 5'-phosphate decarboxylase [Candidatus Woesebacteria bacterium GW2011_GWB1_38_5b]|uniref:Orotidine 5'-phosphate decarboxylase n=4 Tax=Microgenomates group TaxID=1794810 RepID=A0A1F5K4U7_9BACT|nr:MAG: Orotidine 5'-phosphate decarboxylase [Candidatus Daviesbacteria bacterium GW2011_GWA1_36_8]KKQ75779.1 MAG: Orotidine 5'-phosphate decarboxylase [Candidatus Woesebacteria bacterium GW2011_GWB1_38_5b]OGE16802.1 MAG: orotidine 5'-phosphate decarboxylase [Candidatus Daviesbacteria bacterium RIFCSPHIGHO2_01_FULL_36_37]OGE31408.1 MAG: orotidine 5'-phosphate decarboxylase [Candidatus Daviesbacteria bacterium RIFCSPHIGHO2_02_FULL_37_9]OGE35790.1 MAG: orotidine 5'-phosphate decarboxylase [Candid